MHIQDLTKELGGRVVLNRVSFVANAGEVTGIAGANGSGKTTLLRIIAGDLRADSGRITGLEGRRIGYLRQSAEAAPAAASGAHDNEDPIERLAAIADELAHATETERETLADEYDRIVAAMAAGNQGSPSANGLALPERTAATPLDRLSGGERTRLALTEVVAQQPDILLLDEPTNHLDREGIEWVEELLRGFAGTAIVVSHDRALLDACADQIIEIDATTGEAETFAGNYSAYADAKAQREQEAWERYRREQREERRLKETISEIESRARNTENRSINFHYRKRAAKVARRAVTLRARMERQLDSVDHATRPAKPMAALGGAFSTDERGRGRLIAADNVALRAGERELFRGLTFEVRRGERVVLAGRNGAGKTTLLRAILGEQPLAGGSLDVSGSAVIGYLPQSEEELVAFLGDPEANAVKALRQRTSMTDAAARNYLHRFLIGSGPISTPIGRTSFGERRRLALAILIAQGSNLLLLDEPTNHLDVPSREAFEAAFETFTGATLAVTHDRYFIERFADRLVEVG